MHNQICIECGCSINVEISNHALFYHNRLKPICFDCEQDQIDTPCPCGRGPVTRCPEYPNTDKCEYLIRVEDAPVRDIRLPVMGIHQFFLTCK